MIDLDDIRGELFERLTFERYSHTLGVENTALSLAEILCPESVLNVQAAALLHDVVEDTEVTLEDIRNAGFPQEVVEAVGILTRDKSIEYLDYVRGVKGNPIAKKVKLLDLAHNSDPTRLVNGKEKSESLLERYAKAKAILLED